MRRSRLQGASSSEAPPTAPPVATGVSYNGWGGRSWHPESLRKRQSLPARCPPTSPCLTSTTICEETCTARPDASHLATGVAGDSAGGTSVQRPGWPHEGGWHAPIGFCRPSLPGAGEFCLVASAQAGHTRRGLPAPGWAHVGIRTTSRWRAGPTRQVSHRWAHQSHKRMARRGSLSSATVSARGRRR